MLQALSACLKKLASNCQVLDTISKTAITFSVLYFFISNLLPKYCYLQNILEWTGSCDGESITAQMKIELKDVKKVLCGFQMPHQCSISAEEAPARN